MAHFHAHGAHDDHSHGHGHGHSHGHHHHPADFGRAFLNGPIVFLAAGCLEIVSILFRPVSLSFRLYGNVFAGESMLERMATLVPGLGWLLPIPFYFKELLVGLVQAMVFMLLTAVFTLLICQHEDDGHTEVHA